MKMKRSALVLAAILTLAWISLAKADETFEIKAEPENILIDAVYNGMHLNLTGSVPDGSDVIVRFEGAPSELHMKEKGKVMGLLWMNLGSLTFKDVPNVYLLGTAKDFHGFGATAGGSDPALSQLPLAGLKDRIQVVSGTADRNTVIDELIKLKQGEGLYRETPGEVTYGSVSGGRKTFQAEIKIPSRLLPGRYTVEAFAVQNGNIVAHKAQTVTATLVGTPALISNLAFGNGALYGILATVIALLSGLAVGVVFQSKGAH